MFYEYKCRGCRKTILDRARSTAIIHSDCNEIATRLFGFSIRPSMPEHFNHTVGEYVSNSQQFTTALKRKSEEVTIRTGIESTFQPIDLDSRPGVTDEGLYEQAKHRHDKGIILP